MKREELKAILQNAYTQEKWIKTLQFLSGSKNLLTILLEPKAIEIKSAKAKEIVSEIVQLGSIKTTDGITLPIFDVTLVDGIKIEYNRVGVNDLLKNHILKDAIKGAIVTFHFPNSSPMEKAGIRAEWRFSFISKFGSDYFAEAESVETNPKKYTYIFGTSEEHRTALERLYNLEQSRFRLEDFFEAFNVEPVSNNFFKEYKKFYFDFVEELSKNDSSNRAIFEKEGISKDDLEKDIRNFVKRLLGRLVFLYFLQKKHWLGASNKNYDDGDTNFLFNLFNYNQDSKDHFYNKWLSKLFFNALNTPNRTNDCFELPNGNSVWIPFLNGGLFEEHQEPERHREIQFPPILFELLFKFFNGYNFTIYENSPEDHTVAVDPEMLGHIFENLLEDNKDKGAFYTPKEIVHYMTQESLIEYLKTHLSHPREAIENLIKNHSTIDFTREDLKTVEKLIDTVKICDPAIGSGAFPMGLLQEIFALKALIHYELGYTIWSPAKIKQDIIQNSIYGVDLEEGAVDIARLRFWLSLVVDEPTPKPLPNLDYKIVVGNSLVSKLNNNIIDIDWDLKSSVGKADEYIKLLQNGLTELTAKQKEYFFSEKKGELKLVIRNLKIDILINQLSFNKEHFLNKNQVKLDMGFGLKQSEIKENNRINEQVDNFNKTISELNQLKDFPEKPLAFFDWKLNFPEVLNPLLKENGRLNEAGFDIVIGNPPYISAVTMARDEKIKKFFKEKYPEATGSYDLYILFLIKAICLINSTGTYTWIIPNKFLISDYAKKTKENLINKNGLKYSINVSDFNVFTGVGVYPIIIFGNNVKSDNFSELMLSNYNDLERRKFILPTQLKSHNTFKQHNILINSGTTGFQAQQIKVLISDEAKYNSIPFAVSGSIDRYTYSNEWVRYMGEKYKTAYIENNVEIIAKSKWEFWNKPKIVIAGMTKVIEAVYVEQPLGLGVGVYGIYDFGGYDPYCLTALLNSKYLTYYFLIRFKDKHLAGGYLAINKSTIEEFPLVAISNKTQSKLSKLSRERHLNKSNDLNESLNSQIDSIVYKLYDLNYLDVKVIDPQFLFSEEDYNSIEV